MTQPIIWLHDEALRLSHPVFTIAPKDARAIFIWDDTKLKHNGYSLKRLVFIYETLCALPIEILMGDSLSVLSQLAPPVIYVPYSNDAFVQSVLQSLSATTIHSIPDEAFVVIPPKSDFKRFFHYWKKAEKYAFLQNGINHA